MAHPTSALKPETAVAPSSRTESALSQSARTGPAVALEVDQAETYAAIGEGLRRFNERLLGPSERRPLTVSLRDAEGTIIGGLTGEDRRGWLFVSLVWIDDAYHGRGLGREIMATAEAEARRRGVSDVWLDSFTFQAPDFYKKLGYREFGRLADCPAGHDRVFLTKSL